MTRIKGELTWAYVIKETASSTLALHNPERQAMLNVLFMPTVILLERTSVESVI